MTKLLGKRRLGYVGKLAAVPLAMILAGCSPEGTGTVDVGSPNDVRSKLEGDEASRKPLSSKQAKARQIEAEAAKKNPKLQ